MTEHQEALEYAMAEARKRSRRRADHPDYAGIGRPPLPPRPKHPDLSYMMRPRVSEEGKR